MDQQPKIGISNSTETDLTLNSRPVAGVSHKAVPERFLYPQKEAAVLLGISPPERVLLHLDEPTEGTQLGGRRLVPVEEIRRFARSDHGLPG